MADDGFQGFHLTALDARRFDLHARERIEACAQAVRARFPRPIDVAIILGTGLGGLADEIDVEQTIEYKDVPNFPLSTVESHQGRLLCGTLGGKTVVAIASLLTAIDAGCQGALMAPTEVLAEQHYRKLCEWLPQLHVSCALLTGSTPARRRRELLADLAARITPEDVQLYYQTAILGRRDLAWAPDARSGFEMTLLRMLAFRPAGSEGGQAPAAGVAGVSAATSPRPRPVASAPAAAAAGGGSKDRPVVARSSLDDWAATLGQLEIGGAVRQLASHCAYAGRDGAVIRLSLDPAQHTLRTTALVEKLAQALTRHLGETVKVEISIAQSEPDTPARTQERDTEVRLAAARRSIDDDSTVRAFRDKFGATIKPDSIRPT